MAKERFVEIYNQGIVNVAKVIVDTETGEIGRAHV